MIKLPQKYSQMDSRWGSELLGFNTEPQYNIHNYGCLITCLAMIHSYYGAKVDPSLMNNLLKDAKGYAGGGNYIWGTFPKILKKVTEHLYRTPAPLTDDRIEDIKNAIDEGYPVMVQLDYNPRTVGLDMHYVLFIGYNPEDENDFTILDPLGGKVVSLKKYLGWWRPNARRTIEQYVIYAGEALTDMASLEKTILEMTEAFAALTKEHEEKLALCKQECQYELLEVGKDLREVIDYYDL